MFIFDLTPDDIERNRQLRARFNSLNRVEFGGIVLAVKGLTPRQPKFEVKNKSWLTKFDLGAELEETVTYKTNPDGTKTKIRETVKYLSDGTKVTTTEETEFSNGQKLISSSVSQDIPVATEDGEFDLDRAKTRRIKTITTPPDSLTSYISEVVETVNAQDNVEYTYEKKYTDQQKPVPKAKPATLTTVTGKIIDQFIVPAPPQGQDQTWWNEDMYNTESESEQTTTDNGDGTETVTKIERSKNARGELTEIITETTNKKSGDDNSITVTESIVTPLSDKKIVRLYDLDGQLKSTKTTTTSKTDVINGSDQVLVEATVEEKTDENNKKITKTITKETNLVTGQETVQEVEEISDPGLNTIRFNRKISTDELTGVQDIQETKTVTDGYGNITTEEKSYKTPSNKSRTTVEKVLPADMEDDFIDDLVNGYLVVEYEIRGELISAAQAFRIMNKCHDHQTAWAFLSILEEQLSRGEKLSPAKREQLYRQYQATFLGNFSDNVRGGPILDRIEMSCFGEHAIPVVFSPSNSAFQINWIDGANGLYSWSMTVQTYSNIVREKDGRLGANALLGGRYGRTDGEHWYGNSLTPELTSPEVFQDNIDKFKNESEGGEWSYG